MNHLDLKDIRTLEDLIIDSMYADLIKGKLDQKQQLLWIEYTYGRDIKASEMEGMLGQLEQWDKQLE